MSIFSGLPKKQLLGGYDQNAAMMGQSGFAPMNEGFAPQQHAMQPAAKKPGPNWAGIASDFLAGMAGQPGQFAAQQQHERAMQQRTQQAEQERMHQRDNFLFEQNYKRDNPVAQQPTEFERLLDAGGYTPEVRQEKLRGYVENRVNPERAVPYTDEQGNSGLKFIRTGMPTQQQGVQEGATATHPETREKVIYRNGQWKPIGGSVGNGTGGFPGQ